MSQKQYRIFLIAFAMSCLVGLPSCGHDQKLVGIAIQPTSETFGATTVPVSADAGLNVQLRAIGTYIHPPVSKDITNQVTWVSNTPNMVTVNSSGLVTATGNACGNSLISATATTNSSAGNISSSGALVTGSMTANVVCFTGTDPGILVNFAGTGSGTVTSSPAGINCTMTCGAIFVSGTTVMLTAQANGTFGGWANCDSVSTSGLVCTLNDLSVNRNVTVTFN